VGDIIITCVFFCIVEYELILYSLYHRVTPFVTLLVFAMLVNCTVAHRVA